MSLTQTLTATPEKNHSIPFDDKDDLPLRPFLFNLNGDKLIDIAVNRLQSTCIQVIEWGAPLFRRMRVPIIIKDWAYLVPDDDLDAASNILSDMGLPLTPPPELLLATGGDFYSKPRLHRITRSTAMSSVQYLLLYPLAFSSFLPSELTLSPRITTITPPRSNPILHPLQPAVYASIIRSMLAYPRYDCATRITLQSNLSELIGYNLYDLQIGYVDTDDEELCEALEVDRRVDDAFHIVKGWGWDGAWREGEEWMGDALAAIVKGWGEIEYLPWLPEQMSSR